MSVDSGWPAALPDWSSRAWPIVFSRVYAMCKNVHTAEDLTQHAFQRMHEQWSSKQVQFDGFPQLCRWLTKTACHRMVDLKRRRSETGLVDVGEPIADNELDPRWRVAFDAALQHLTMEDRNILEKKYGSDENCTDEELGEMLFGVEGTASARGQKARRRRLEAAAHLQAELLKEGLDPDTFDFRGLGSLIRKRYRSDSSQGAVERSPTEEGDVL